MINNSYLLGLFGASADTASAFSGAASSVVPRKKQPTAPWTTDIKPTEANAIVRAALSGRRLINESAARLDVAGASSDYRKLFALYQGLSALEALAKRADERGIGTSEAALIQKRFDAGLLEVGGYLQTADFSDLRMVQGVSTTTAKTSAAVAKDGTRIVTAPVHEGALTSAVAGFAGEVKFYITISTINGDKTISIDLADMGEEDRTLDNVIAHVNARLETAEVSTRLSRENVTGEPRTIKAGGKTITLPAQADRWALVIQGTNVESVRFAAEQTSDAVYVVQAAGAARGAELLKFQSDGGAAPEPPDLTGQTGWVAGRVAQARLPKGVEAVRASAVAADGSLWIVADVEPSTGSQPVKGQRDVALMRFDSSGRHVASRMLGAAAEASGYALAIATDGRVAVAGSVIGALEPGVRVTDAELSDSFVTVFDATGEELWTQRRGARAADEATAVSFGADGEVYVAGRSRSGMPGASALGGWDGYLQGFTATRAHSLAPMVATAVSINQFGTAEDDSVKAMTVDGTSIYTAGIEGGRVIVRHYSPGTSGAPSLAAVRDLGDASGDVTGIAVSGGRIVLTGMTRNAALDVGTVNTAHSGGMDAYVAVLETDLAVSPTDRLTYFGGVGDDSASDMKVHGGKVWITGIADRPVDALDEDPRQGYLTRLDPLTGAIEWTRTWAGEGQQAAPMTLAVASGGASVLDRLGLPQGLVTTEDSKLLTTATALRPGDRFYVSPADGSRTRAVTIDARDTLQTLARKVELAGLGQLKVTVVTDSLRLGGVVGTTGGLMQRLSITTKDGRVGAVLSSGEPGRDALAGLGLSPGIVAPRSGTGDIKTVAMALPQTLSLSGSEQVKATLAALNSAMSVIRSAYRSLAPATTTTAPTGPAPAYLTAQLANYQAALARLGG